MVLWVVRQYSIDSSRSFTLVCAWRLIHFSLNVEKKRSTIFNQDADVGVKWTCSAGVLQAKL